MPLECAWIATGYEKTTRKTLDEDFRLVLPELVDLLSTWAGSTKARRQELVRGIDSAKFGAIAIRLTIY